MDTFGDLVTAGRDREGTVIETLERTTPYSYQELATNTWKAGNLLGQYGAHPGSEVTVVIAPVEAGDESPDIESVGILDSPAPLLAVLGGPLLGATVTLKPASPIESSVLVRPVGMSEAFEVSPGTSVLGYGDKPDQPQVAHFEAETWSETPVEPPEPVAPADPALRFGDTDYSHADLLAAAERVVADENITSESIVGLAAPVTDPEAVITGVLAPMVAGATIVVGDDYAQIRDRPDVTHLVADGDAAREDHRRIPLDTSGI
jgi:hypothetical protein